MESQQIVDYIAQQLSAGHSEATLREHLVQHGWSQAATDDAFSRYHQNAKPKRTPKVKNKALRKGGRQLGPKWAVASWIKLGIAVAVLVVVLMAAHGFMVHKKAPALPVVKAVELTYKERQANDINLVAGAIGQYAAASNGVLPTALSKAADGNLVLCGATCDATTSEVTSLSVYKPEEVKLTTYVAGLTAPDKGTMYIVPGATCVAKSGTIAVSTKPKAMVILYAQVDGTSLTQHCIIL